MSKTYILQKDLPNVKAGTRVTWNSTETWAGGPYGKGRYGVWPMPSDKSCDILFTVDDVENNPEWFLPEENKSNDSFQWTREFIEEMIWEEWGHKDVRAVLDQWEEGNPQFKQSHTPKPQAEGLPLPSDYIFPDKISVLRSDGSKNDLLKSEWPTKAWTAQMKIQKHIVDNYPPQAENKPDFVPIEKIMDKMFEERGWNKKAENKPDWEIVAIATADDRVHQLPLKDEFNRVVEKDKDGNLIVAVDGRLSNTMIKYGWKIHSVKRLSDGEVFSVGDEVVHKTDGMINTAKILKFVIPEVIKNKMWFEFQDGATYVKDLANFNKLPPQPQKLFTTVDKFSWNNCNKEPYICDKSCVTECKNLAAWKERNPSPQDHIGIDRNGEDTKKERIEIQCFDANMGKHPYNDIYNDEPPFSHVLWTARKIPTEKLTPIKQAIEQVLNGDEHFFLNKANYDKLPPYLKLYNQQQVDELCEKAFWAGREISSGAYKHGSFQNYKNSKQ